MTRPDICAVVSASGPNGEPLACGYAPGHDGAHSWASLPTLPTPGSLALNRISAAYWGGGEEEVWDAVRAEVRG